MVAVAHPHLLAGADAPGALEQRAILGDLDMGAAEFADLGALHGAAELRAHHHLAVADAEHRHPGGEHEVRRARRAGIRHAGRAAGQDDAVGAEGSETGGLRVEGQNLAIDAAFADAAGDELGDLAAEIEDQNLLLVRCINHGAELA